MGGKYLESHSRPYHALCELDPLPTSFVKQHIDALSPLLATTVFRAPMKHAVVVPILKKGGSDANSLTNYRPISNIAFAAKTTERFVAQQVHFMEESGTVRTIVRKPHSCGYTTTSPIRLTIARVCSSCYSI